MMTLTKILTAAALGMVVSSAAGANVVITLTQVGGTYSASAGVQAGDTLVLDVGYDITAAGDNITLIDPAIAYDSVAAIFVGGSETGFSAWSGGDVTLDPVGPAGLFHDEVLDATTRYVGGLERAESTLVGANPPCVSGACTSLGTLTFSLTGAIGPFGGRFDPGVVFQPTPFGTTIQSGVYKSVTSSATLGTFRIVPEPTTSALLGLGLLGLTAVVRRRGWPR